MRQLTPVEILPHQIERLAVLEREIEDCFADPSRSELRLDLDRCVPIITAVLAKEVLRWARSMGYLARLTGRSLLLKKASRCL
jgi:hypothetical protein